MIKLRQFIHYPVSFQNPVGVSMACEEVRLRRVRVRVRRARAAIAVR